MRIASLAINLFLISVCVSAFGQDRPKAAPKTDSAIGFISQALKLVSSHVPDRKVLRSKADEIARTYSGQLKTLPKRMGQIESDFADKFGQMDLKAKANLVAELWRVRKSIDFMSLMSPEMVQEITGLDHATLVNWTARIKAIEDKIRKTFRFRLSA